MNRLLVAAALMGLSACDAIVGLRAGEPAGHTAHASALAPTNLPEFFDCLRERGQTIVAAHRGGPTPDFAENAIPTFEHTLAQTPAFLEVDVSRTRDRQLVLMHDDTVDRTTNGEGEVDRMTLAEFQALQLEGETGAVLDAHPPTLREALDWAEGRTVLELDVKRDVSYEDVVGEVEAAGAMDRVIFITYSVNAAARMAAVAPQAMISVTIETEGDLADLRRHGVDLAHVVAWTGIEEPNPSLNVALAQAGVEASFGTLGGSNSWDARFARTGRRQYAVLADTGLAVISTDRPEAALADLDAHDGDESSYRALQCVGAH